MFLFFVDFIFISVFFGRLGIDFFAVPWIALISTLFFIDSGVDFCVCLLGLVLMSLLFVGWH